MLHKKKQSWLFLIFGLRNVQLKQRKRICPSCAKHLSKNSGCAASLSGCLSTNPHGRNVFSKPDGFSFHSGSLTKGTVISRKLFLHFTKLWIWNRNLTLGMVKYIASKMLLNLQMIAPQTHKRRHHLGPGESSFTGKMDPQIWGIVHNWQIPVLIAVCLCCGTDAMFS